MGPGTAIDRQLEDLKATAEALLATSILSLALASVALWLWRENRALTRQLGRPGGRHAPPTALAVGSAAPSFALSDEHGQQATLLGLLDAGRPLILVFTVPKCGPCQV